MSSDRYSAQLTKNKPLFSIVKQIQLPYYTKQSKYLDWNNGFMELEREDTLLVHVLLVFIFVPMWGIMVNPNLQSRWSRDLSHLVCILVVRRIQGSLCLLSTCPLQSLSPPVDMTTTQTTTENPRLRRPEQTTKKQRPLASPCRHGKHGRFYLW